MIGSCQQEVLEGIRNCAWSSIIVPAIIYNQNLLSRHTSLALDDQQKSLERSYFFNQNIDRGLIKFSKKEKKLFFEKATSTIFKEIVINLCNPVSGSEAEKRQKEMI